MDENRRRQRRREATMKHPTFPRFRVRTIDPREDIEVRCRHGPDKKTRYGHGAESDTLKLVLEKGDSTYIFIVCDCTDYTHRNNALRTFGRFAANPELEGFTWKDQERLAAMLERHCGI